MKIFVASFHRASDDAVSKLVQKMKEHGLWIDDYKKADYILAVADRLETFSFVLERFKENKKIIHLLAGEKSCWTTHDDTFRWAMTSMAEIALCTNYEAEQRVEQFCNAIDKKADVHVVGNVYLDSLEVENVEAKWAEFDVVLYNPPSRFLETIKSEIKEIIEMLGENYYWISPNGDKGSDLIEQHVNTKTLPRPMFLGLLKKCRRFITNSSCQYFEAPFVMDKDKIISIGKRNIGRGSKYSDMTIENASDNIIKILEELK